MVSRPWPFLPTEILAEFPSLSRNEQNFNSIWQILLICMHWSSPGQHLTVISLLQAAFHEQQEHASQDYLEASGHRRRAGIALELQA